MLDWIVIRGRQEIFLLILYFHGSLSLITTSKKRFRRSFLLFADKSTRTDQGGKGHLVRRVGVLEELRPFLRQCAFAIENEESSVGVSVAVDVHRRGIGGNDPTDGNDDEENPS